MNKSSIMFLGTASSVGKSMMAAALLRILKNKGFSVAPFKALNISLNSYVTYDGLEIGVAQKVQAEAAKIEPSVLMNPVLLKPASGKTQVIVEGKVVKTINPYEYTEINDKLKIRIKKVYNKIRKNYDIIVLEGSGSCAEINLRETDIANIEMAKMSKSPIILVSDIDRGGVFASIYGTLSLIREDERKMVKGVIINKFRGDKKRFEKAVTQLEDIIKIPVLGVMPYEELNIDDEDAVTEKLVNNNDKKSLIDIVVIKLKSMSNFTDFNTFSRYEFINVRYVDKSEDIGNPDLIIIPGTKNTIKDLRFLKKKGLFEKIIEKHQNGTVILGICGGYQMLGNIIVDSLSIESDIREETGFSLLNFKTRFSEEKVTRRANCTAFDSINVSGYEIHNGISKIGKNSEIFMKSENGSILGICNKEHNVFGTYLHGVFDSDEFLDYFLENVLKINLDSYMTKKNEAYDEFKDRQYEKLADVFEKNIDVDKIITIINNGL
ncbi:cobyric acid synthase [Clostridium sp. BJN0001]|uniref:cobyric acid synthase n=1 Tax=Clostridium sp. BJN0001 TaxID=2930219 RepID=UPI001FD3355F|nr:cobyric acid synthase [Clostridium sp. BJN0001]